MNASPTEHDPAETSPGKVERIGVIGAGTMGSGIAQVAAQSGFFVVLVDSDRDALERGVSSIERQWVRAIEKGRATASDIERARTRLDPQPDIVSVARCDAVIEAIIERVDAKRAVFEQIATVVPETTLLASNTSSISITLLAAAVPHPERVVGLHFFNPVPVMKLVEVVAGEQTSAPTLVCAVSIAHDLGKTPVTVNDFPGFVSNRVLMPMINEAIFCLGEGVATRESIDDIMRLGMAHPMGPLTLADLIGLDVCLDILETLQRDFGDDKYRPAPLLRRYVAAGKLGKKSGEGFYRYDPA